MRGLLPGTESNWDSDFSLVFAHDHTPGTLSGQVRLTALRHAPKEQETKLEKGPKLGLDNR